MRFLNEIGVSLKWFYRGLRNGEWKWLFIAIVIATLTVTAVDQLAQTIKQSMLRQAAINLGADLVINSSRPIDKQWQEKAEHMGLSVAQSETVVTMANYQDRFQLIQLKAISNHYPLRKEGVSSDPVVSSDQTISGPIEKGTVWIQSALQSQLNLDLGEKLTLGERQFKVTKRYEPQGFQGGLDAFAYEAKMRLDELSSTGLLGPGSRVHYEMMFAGPPDKIKVFADLLRTSNSPAWQILSAEAPSEDLAQSLDTAWLFLELSSLSAVLVAGLAIIISSGFYLKRWQNSLALMRALGANHGQLKRLFAMQMMWLAFFAGLLGSTLGGIVFYSLTPWLADFFDPLVSTPVWPSWAKGIGIGALVLWSFAWPAFQKTLNTSALFLLKRQPSGLKLTHLLLSLGLIALLSLSLVSRNNAAWILGGLAGMALIFYAGSWLLLILMEAWQHRSRGWMKLALASLLREPALVTQQTIALGLVLFVLMLMTFVRQDLLAQWQATLPENTPNTFLVNVQPNQTPTVSKALHRLDVTSPLVSMARGRLVEINQTPVDLKNFPSRRAQRLLSREANVGVMITVPDYNIETSTLASSQRNPKVPWISVEQGIAELLDLRLGDVLTFNFAGVTSTYQITSLRKVTWQSFRLNFFFIIPPPESIGGEEGYNVSTNVSTFPISYLSSFYLAEKAQTQTLAKQMAEEAPGVVVVDVRHLLSQIQEVMNQASWAVTGLYAFTLLASLVVLFAATLASQQNRYQTWLLLKTLGATQSIVVKSGLSEFALLGGLAALLAALFAQMTGVVLSITWLNIEPAFNLWLWLTALACGVGGLVLFGWLSQRRAIRMTPKELSRQLTDV